MPSIDVFRVGLAVGIFIFVLPAIIAAYLSWSDPEKLRGFLVDYARKTLGTSLLADAQISFVQSNFWLWMMRIGVPILIPVTLGLIAYLFLD